MSNCTKNLTVKNLQVISAGITLFSFAPENNNVYFLMGQDRRTSWNSLEKWSDFGGVKTEDETSTHCAAREFVEETMGMIPGMADIDTVQEMLDNNEYTFKIIYFVYNTNRSSSSEKCHKGLRVCYVKQIDWDPDIPNQFETTYTKMSNLSILGSSHAQDFWKNELTAKEQCHPCIQWKNDCPHVDKHWIEKQRIQWWSLPRLKTVLRNRGRFRMWLFRKGFLPTLSVIIEKFEFISSYNKVSRSVDFVANSSETKFKHIIDHYLYLIHQRVNFPTEALPSK